eukprot:3006811-Amphidinium_carterae.1
MLHKRKQQHSTRGQAQKLNVRAQVCALRDLQAPFLFLCNWSNTVSPCRDLSFYIPLHITLPLSQLLLEARLHAQCLL